MRRKGIAAAAAIDRMITALSGPGDRTYLIQMEDLPERDKWRSKDKPSSVPKPGLVDTTLYLRDGQQYVLVRHDPQGGMIYDGYDGRQSWRVRDGKVAETRQGLGAGGIPMPPIMANIPFTDLQSTLPAIQGNYTLEKQGNVARPGGNSKLPYVLVRGTNEPNRPTRKLVQRRIPCHGTDSAVVDRFANAQHVISVCQYG